MLINWTIVIIALLFVSYFLKDDHQVSYFAPDEGREEFENV